LAGRIQSRLQSRNVTVGGHRTSLRLEQDVWDALEEVCSRENLNLHELCTHIEVQKTGASRTAAVRAYVLGYFREAASDTGHVRAGHGSLSQGSRTQGSRSQGSGAKKNRPIAELRSTN
jgi:predicted DNA-binding ribbon-helix-helix protein